MKKLLPILLLLLGLGGGGAAGFFLKPAPDPEEAAKKAEAAAEAAADPAAPRNYVKVGRQTIVPVVEGGQTKALMLFELAVDVPAGRSGDVHDMEPRLRDAFLRELFRMSHTGAFLSNFTDDRVIEELRKSLTRAAREHLGEDVNEVLILDVMRQEL